MYDLVLALHVILAIILVVLVLLQQGKGADVGAVMSGGGANTLFGVGGASSLLVRATTGIAICFMLTSIFLVKLGSDDNIGISTKADVLEGLDSKSLETTSSAPAAAPQAPQAPGVVPPVSNAQ